MRALRPVFLVLIVVGFAGTFFFSGYGLGRSRAPEVDRVLASTLESIGLDRLTSVVQPPASSPDDVPLSQEARERFKVFWEAWSWIDREFYDRTRVDPEAMTHGAVRGMLDSLGDPHTVFLDPEHQRLSEAELMGAFDGIGVQVDVKDGRLRVVAPLDGMPGDRAGLRPGDVITHINEESTAEMTLVDAVLRIRGQRGTVVLLRVQREGLTEPLDFEIAREEIKLPSVRWELREQDIGYIRLSGFNDTTAADTSRALGELLERNPRGLILDLRNNPGGYLHVAVDVASQFLKEGVVLYQQHATGHRQPFQVKPGGAATDIPLVVLVNGGSASASEIVAGALQAHGRAQLLGERTFGKGTVQKIHELSDGSSIRVTFARWLTPANQPLEGQGLQPDLEVAEAPQGEPDAQLRAAEQHLLERVS